MIPVEEMEHHPVSEQLVQILCSKTQNDNPLFFRVLVGYYFSLVASMMRITIVTHDRGDLPVNMYALNLSPSGTGKGFSTNIMENRVIHLFRQRFLEETLPLLAAQNLPKLATKRANRKGVDPDDELMKVEKEYENLGPLVFSFDSGTPAAVKQMRHKLLMVDAGSVNLQIDEIGSNFTGAIDVLNTFLELYDVGRIKQKLIKNTSENLRNEEIDGETPTNMMLFGTPSKLLNGSKVEEELYSMLETGYARRCFFGYSRASTKKTYQTPEEVYNQLTQASDDQFLEQIADQLERLADMINVNKHIIMSKETTLLAIEYRLQCERIADALPEHEEIRKAEIAHRYFKALKLAGAYAFIDDSSELTSDHLYQAIRLCEESGEAFGRLMTRDRNHVKLAKYIASAKKEVTQADLVEDLPFYRGAAGQKTEMLNLAIAYGYQNNIIIKKSFQEGIEFLRGETLAQTNLNEVIVSYSKDYTTGYLNERIPFDQMHKLTQAQGMHWVAHHLVNGFKPKDPNGTFEGGYRNEENCIPGFNLAVIDVDGSTKIEAVKALLKNYRYLLYTTKSHTEQEHCFRVIFPLNYELKFDAKDYKEFMSNLYEWLPFDVDTSTNQRARKWMSHNGTFEYNEGELLNALPFIPKTSKNEARKALLKDQQSMDNLERWIMNNIGDGNRNNMLLRFAMILVENGAGFDQILSRVNSLNSKIADKLEEAEILSTIMVTVGKALASRAAEA